MYQSHTGRLAGLWFLPKPAFRLNTNDDDVLAVRGFFNERWIAPSVEGSSSPAFKLLFWHCPESMEEDHEKPRSPYRVFKMRVELLGPKEDEANQLDQNVRRHILFI